MMIVDEQRKNTAFALVGCYAVNPGKIAKVFDEPLKDNFKP
ncbi:MAG: hypothetical protein N4A71_25545 [Carboxylicivirga sp.]|jgi:hypothetical protein|nr:hypothetical protein [Carboxylicivirga sp.]MCT4646296.1 hypothetical protein [Carboxylicivirga sp.]